jgi:hypothetical protein
MRSAMPVSATWKALRYTALWFGSKARKSWVRSSMTNVPSNTMDPMALVMTSRSTSRISLHLLDEGLIRKVHVPLLGKLPQNVKNACFSRAGALFSNPIFCAIRSAVRKPIPKMSLASR